MTRVTGAVRRAAVLLAVLAGCSDPVEHGEFPGLAHGEIRGIVYGNLGQPLDSVFVTFAASESAGQKYAFGSHGQWTGADGRFTISVRVFDAMDLSNLPDTVDLFVRATAHPPRYPAPAGEENITVSVLVATALAVAESPAPRTDAEITLPIP